tara:strand:+ start:2242 stop:2535 length:294 start_codon:yes stop_codon:yes gene_type:complete
LHVRADTVLIEKWDHTATLESVIDNLKAVLPLKPKYKPKPAKDRHPYRSKVKKKKLDFQTGFSTLKAMAGNNVQTVSAKDIKVVHRPPREQWKQNRK